jgi:hypothetical protein
VPPVVCLRTRRSTRVVRAHAHVLLSSPQSRSAWDTVRLSPGISRYSPSIRRSSSRIAGVLCSDVLRTVRFTSANFVTRALGVPDRDSQCQYRSEQPEKGSDRSRADTPGIGSNWKRWMWLCSRLAVFLCPIGKRSGTSGASSAAASCGVMSVRVLPTCISPVGQPPTDPRLRRRCLRTARPRWSEASPEPSPCRS